VLAHRAPPSGSSDELARLRADLHEADFTLERLGELLGPVAAAALHREQVLPATLALAESTDRAAVLARLFVLGLPVEGAELDRVLPRTGAAGLARTALTRRAPVDYLEGEWWQATCELRPYGDGSHHWWLPSDFGEAVTRGPLPTDHVLGLGGASATLASWTPRPLVARALDLGTGCGVQALHLTTHAATVVATDVSTRALGFARLTAGLNGLGIEVRQGSLLEPVAGEVFDLIVSNPPFVITPRDPTVPQYEYRDGGRSGDALVAGLVRDIGAHLAPGGIAQLLGNWEMRPGETWRERVGSWVEGTGLDAWVVQRDEQDTAQYAETWIRDGGLQPGSPEFETLYAAWLADFAGRDVERIGFGVVTLHRPMASRHPWRHLEEVSGPVSSPLGPSLLNGLRARSWLTEHSSDELLDTAWTVAEDVTEERVGWPGAPDPTVIQLRQGGGLRRTVRLDTVTAALVGACDGDLTARQILAGVAVLLERPVGEVTAAALPLLRDLVADGLVAPAAEGETSW
jgi:methylase of polypeptide subunit release factors